MGFRADDEGESVLQGVRPQAGPAARRVSRLPMLTAKLAAVALTAVALTAAALALYTTILLRISLPVRHAVQAAR
ncbi:hypothetical protein RFN58_34120 [Streptomyces iakyrus]|uniref:hypothetical protein n=1 Tax=Streptomyces iakyrus TaxID=68219 RepID=UPI0012FE8035|nr:hypothetical protein [Streptomyces iakyrus]